MKNMKIGVLDYSAGNVASVLAALQKAEAMPALVSTLSEINECDSLVIPGMGSFAYAMSRISVLRDGLASFAESGKPILGICLGMQVLFEEGIEGGRTPGFGLIRGRVDLLEAKKLPHIGWNTLQSKHFSQLLEGIPEKAFFYFAHSYACRPAMQSNLVAETIYENKFASVVEEKNVFGVQFHPDKSGEWGLRLLKNFVEVTKECK